MAIIDSSSYIMKNNKKVTIRSAQVTDAQDLLNYIKLNGFEPEFNIRTVDEFHMTVKQEEEWLKSIIEYSGDLGLVAIYQEKIIGFLDFHQNRPIRMRHKGAFGMSVHKDYRNQGVGKALLEELLKWARNHKDIEIVNLGVLSSNPRAIHLYKKIGFVKEGLHRNYVKNIDGTYIDGIDMKYDVK